MNEKTLANFEVYLGTQIPGFRVAYKADSKLMAFFGFLLKLFNPKFMDDYATTWGNTVYFPSREFYLRGPASSLITLSHEFVHLSDAQEYGFLKFKGAYSMPQIFALLPLLTYAALGSLLSTALLIVGYTLASLLAYKNRILGFITLGIFLLGSLFVGWLFSGLWVLLLPAALVCLFLPSKGRTKWELRGYLMNISVLRWVFNQAPDPAYYEVIRKQFTGPSYLFMCWSRSSIENSLQALIKHAEDGTSQKTGPYQKVHDFLASHGLTH